MVLVNYELMRRSRVGLGWTAENLAEESGLDARTIRRIEQGGSLTRLRSAVAIARALKLELAALVLDGRSGASEARGDRAGLAGALAAADGTIQREIVNCGEWSLKEALYVLSILLTRSLVVDGKMSGENDEVDRVVAAFKAADSAIQTTLSGGGEWGAEEAARVLSLLLTRYGTVFSRRSTNGVEVGVNFVQAACEQAKRELPHYLAPK